MFTPDVAARHLLLNTMGKIRPEFLASLFRNCAQPVLEWCLKHNGPFLEDSSLRPVGLACCRWLAGHLAESDLPEAAPARQAMLAWVDQFLRLNRADWALDAGVYTIAMDGFASQGQWDRSYFWYPGYLQKLFTPTRLFHLPYKSGDCPKKFRSKATQILNQEITQFLRDHASGVMNGQAKNHANWTARWITGESYGRIAREVRGKDPEGAVSRAVSLYRKRVGL